MNKRSLLALSIIITLNTYSMKNNELSNINTINTIYNRIDERYFAQAEKDIQSLPQGLIKQQAKNYLTTALNDIVNQCYINIDEHKFDPANDEKNSLPEGQLFDKVQEDLAREYNNSIQGKYEVIESEFRDLEEHDPKNLDAYEELLTTLECVWKEKAISEEEKKRKTTIARFKESLRNKVNTLIKDQEVIKDPKENPKKKQKK